VSGLTIDVCQGGCAGIWFDRAELRSVDEPTTKAGEALVALAGKPQITMDAAKRRRCPKCPDSVLMRHFSSAKRAVAVDECPTCAGARRGNPGHRSHGADASEAWGRAALRHISIAHRLIATGRVVLGGGVWLGRWCGRLESVVFVHRSLGMRLLPNGLFYCCRSYSLQSYGLATR